MVNFKNLKLTIPFLLLSIALHSQNLKPVVIDSFYLFTEPQTKRIIEIIENGFVAFDSLQREKAITLEQDKTISSQDLQILEFKASGENMNEQVEIYVQTNKKLKRSNVWLKIKGTISNILNVLLILAILLVTV